MSTTGDYITWNDQLKPMLPEFPFGNTFKGRISNSLFLISFLQAVPFLILAWKVYKTRHSEGLVLSAYYLQIGISSFWIAYGLILSNVVIVLASTLIIIATIILIVLIHRARKEEK